MKRVRDAQAQRGKQKGNAVLPHRVADACCRWASCDLTKKGAAAEAGISISMFDRIVAAHGITRNPCAQIFADVCAKWEAGKISKQTAIRESRTSGTEFNVLLRNAGKPLYFDGEKSHWLVVLENSSFEAVWHRCACGELTTAKAAATCGLPQRDFKIALQHRLRSLLAESDLQDIRNGAKNACQHPVETLSSCASGMLGSGRHVLYLHEDMGESKHCGIPYDITPDAEFRDIAGRGRPQMAACLAALKPGDTLCVLRETHLADDFGQAVELLGRLARMGVNVLLDSSGKLLRSENSPYLRLDAKIAAAMVKFRQLFVTHKECEGLQRRIARG